MATATACPICDEPAHVGRDKEHHEVRCLTCGRFRIGDVAVWFFELRQLSSSARADLLLCAKELVRDDPNGIAVITGEMISTSPGASEAIPDELVRKLIRLSLIARMELDLLPEHRALVVRRMTREGDVVFGVWENASEPSGFSVLCIKGEHLLREITTPVKTSPNLVVAIPCERRDQALALRKIANLQ